MPVGVRVEGARPPVQQLDDFEACDVLAHKTVVAAADVELVLPGKEDPVPQAGLQRLELLRFFLSRAFEKERIEPVLHRLEPHDVQVMKGASTGVACRHKTGSSQYRQMPRR
jgi:hypothetical protein